MFKILQVCFYCLEFLSLFMISDLVNSSQVESEPQLGSQGNEESKVNVYARTVLKAHNKQTSCRCMHAPGGGSKRDK